MNNNLRNADSGQWLLRLWKILLTSLLLLSGLTFAANPAASVQLRIAKAYAALEQGNTHEAAELCLTLLREATQGSISASTFKDPYFILGELHHATGLHLTALDYYQKALSHDGTFLIKENNIRLQYQLSAMYYYNHQPQQQLQALSNTIAVAETNGGSFYQQYASKAHYLLALAHWGFENKPRSLEHFTAMLQANYKKPIVYLLLTYYYATVTEDELKEAYTRKPRAPANLANIPAKAQRFTFYHKQYRKALSAVRFGDPILKELKPYLSLMPNIEDYAAQLQAERAAKRAADYEYLQNIQNAQNKTNIVPAAPVVPAPVPVPVPATKEQAAPPPAAAAPDAYRRGALEAFTTRIEKLYRTNDVPTFLKQ